MSGSYATPAQFKQHFDARIIGDLPQDAGAQVSAANILTDANVQIKLDYSAGEMDAAMLVGGRYTPLQMTTLMAATDDASLRSQAMIVGINCDLAITHLVERRLWFKMTEMLQAIFERAEKHLISLRKGEEMFYIPENVAAAVTKVTGPTTRNLEDLRTIRRTTLNYFPTTPLPYDR